MQIFEMDPVRQYSTIGIEGFVCGPLDPLPSEYLSPSAADSAPLEKSSYTSWEIIGKIKEKPEDFVVREILPKEDAKFSKLWSHYETAVNDSSASIEKNQPLNIAALPQISPIKLTSPPDQTSNESRDNSKDSESTDEQPRKKTIMGDKIPTIVSESSSSNKPILTEIPMEKSIEIYIANVTTTKDQASSLLQSIEGLNKKATNRIPSCQSDNTAPAAAVSSIEDSEVWIPPLHLQNASEASGAENATGGPASETEMKAQRKAFHKAIRILYPFLKTESSAKLSASQPAEGNEKKATADHWIKVTIENTFDDLVEYLYTPQDDLRELFLFRNWGFEGPPQQSTSSTNETIKPKATSSVVLKLRPGVSKDDRRNVHHILAQKNKHFETSIRQQTSNASKTISTEDQPATTDLVVSWKKQALRKGFQKNNKRKRSENGRNSSGDHRDNHILCVLKKTQKEHLTTLHMLSRSLRCRQGDIGVAGIKDMQAITYQFMTLRSMGFHRAERAIRHQLRSRDVELKILCSNVDFVLNIGDLKGNQFEILVRDLKRVKVDRVSSDSSATRESFVDCDKSHIDQMAERVKQHGFINFYGEQRIGAPGTSVQVGVRAFDIGRAMLRKDFKGAIDLLMEGTRHNETDEARKVRQAWKDSNSNPSVTLKAFGKADIMPRERTILRGLNRYPDNPLEAIRFLSYNMRIFYINAYQSYIFNKAASRRVKLYGNKVVKGDLYLEKDDDHRDDVKVVQGNENPPIEISQVVLPLPGYNVQYPSNDIGDFYQELLAADGIKFEENAVAEATAKGTYRKLIVRPVNLSVEAESSDSPCESMKLSFQLPKGSYATMLLREMMMTTVVRPVSREGQ